ncbi:MAG: hypothetical protein ACK5NK_15675 [Niabella sp.]
MSTLLKRLLLVVMLISTYTVYSQNANSGEQLTHPPIPLAFTFVDLQSTIQNDSLFIKWTSLEEQQLEKFIMEVSQDGSNFYPIDSIPAKIQNGAATENLQYEYAKCMKELCAKNNIIFAVVFSPLLLLFAGFKRLRVSLLLITLVGSIVFISCTKTNGDISVSSDEIKHENYDYLRVARVDKQGDVGYSKIVKIYK